MVSYEEWVGIVRETAGRKGADLSDFETNSTVVSVAASIWNDRPDLKTAPASTAREVAESEVTVR